MLKATLEPAAEAAWTLASADSLCFWGHVPVGGSGGCFLLEVQHPGRMQSRSNASRPYETFHALSDYAVPSCR